MLYPQSASISKCVQAIILNLGVFLWGGILFCLFSWLKCIKHTSCCTPPPPPCFDLLSLSNREDCNLIMFYHFTNQLWINLKDGVGLNTNPGASWDRTPPNSSLGWPEEMALLQLTQIGASAATLRCPFAQKGVLKICKAHCFLVTLFWGD